MQAIGLVMGSNFDRVYVLGQVIGHKSEKWVICEGGARSGKILMAWALGTVHIG